ncbi:DNA topoisomerase IB [Flavobacterium seoulense]|uniref:DNA topoisomerase n=1 Tax=Flavobacterium seoulense TaxID=1492738 RepID=A0A066WUA5_9FLAO|nr:DNA topoisomerase IB [Flavobacterium seoulense]KDN54549.1 DNA topoisomerase I [Flavobacterium seoulense]
METGKVDYEQLMCHPEEVLSNYNLIYAYDEDLTIVRKKQGKNFIYLMNGKRLNEAKALMRIKKLVIPPMWEDVKISNLENSHLQAVGRDARNRKQYLYHTNWNTIRNSTKFYKMYSFGKNLPLIRKKIDSDLNRRGWPKEKVVALVIRLMEETHIRIGNSFYEKENKTYGLTTLRKRHVNIFKDQMKIEFTGKKGIKHTVTVRNKKMIRLVSRCEELPGWVLFQFIDENGERKSLKSNHVNEYLQEICGNNFTAKDFRTWSASLSFFNALMELEKPTSETGIKSNILKAYECASIALGNTKNVCRKYYVHPVIVDAYQDGTLEKSFNRVKRSTTINPYFSASEKEILKLFKAYEPSF